MKRWNWKLIAAVAVWVGILAFVLYAGTHPNPEGQRRLYGWLKTQKWYTTPFSPLDFWGGVVLGAMSMCMLIGIALLWPLRKALDEDPGPKGGGTPPRRKIPMPLIGKVVSIEDFRKTPTDGQIHMATT
jgi:hypothetical protein